MQTLIESGADLETMIISDLVGSFDTSQSHRNLVAIHVYNANLLQL